MQELGEWEEGNLTAALDKNLLSRFAKEHSTSTIFLKIKQHHSQRPNYTYSGLNRFTGTTGKPFTVWQKLLFRRWANWNFSFLILYQLRVRYKYTMAQLYLTENYDPDSGVGLDSSTFCYKASLRSATPSALSTTSGSPVPRGRARSRCQLATQPNLTSGGARWNRLRWSLSLSPLRSWLMIPASSRERAGDEHFELQRFGQRKSWQWIAGCSIEAFVLLFLSMCELQTNTKLASWITPPCRSCSTQIEMVWNTTQSTGLDSWPNGSKRIVDTFTAQK